MVAAAVDLWSKPVTFRAVVAVTCAGAVGTAAIIAVAATQVWCRPWSTELGLSCTACWLAWTKSFSAAARRAAGARRAPGWMRLVWSGGRGAMGRNVCTAATSSAHRTGAAIRWPGASRDQRPGADGLSTATHSGDENCTAVAKSNPTSNRSGVSLDAIRRTAPARSVVRATPTSATTHRVAKVGVPDNPLR